MQLGLCLEIEACISEIWEHFSRAELGDMPRVVANQKEKFQNDDIFQKLSREGEVRTESFDALCLVNGFDTEAEKFVQRN